MPGAAGLEAVMMEWTTAGTAIRTRPLTWGIRSVG